MNADGTNQTRLTINSANDTEPALSLDGSKIAFTSNRNVNFEIYVMNADGSNPVNLSMISPGFDATSSWGGQATPPTPTPTPIPTPGDTCTPTTTVTEGDLFLGGIVSFSVTSGPGSVTIDHVNGGTGLQSLTVVRTPMNAVVNIPPFTSGTFNPVTVTFTTPNPNLAVDFTLRTANNFHAVFIRVRCATPNGGLNSSVIGSENRFRLANLTTEAQRFHSRRQWLGHNHRQQQPRND